MKFSRYKQSNKVFVAFPLDSHVLRTSLITGIRRIPSTQIKHNLACASALACPRFSCRGNPPYYFRGDGEIRTHDPLLARQVLSQLSYTPIPKVWNVVHVARKTIRNQRFLIRFPFYIVTSSLSYMPFPSYTLSSMYRHELLYQMLATTYSPTSSPMQYHRPLKS